METDGAEDKSKTCKTTLKIKIQHIKYGTTTMSKHNNYIVMHILLAASSKQTIVHGLTELETALKHHISTTSLYIW